MSLLYQCSRFAVFEPSSDSEAAALDNMQPDKHIYYLQFNHALFQSVTWRERMIMICSATTLELSPPSIPYKKCLAEILPNTTANDYELTEEEKDCISELPSGWQLSDLKAFAGYRLPPLPEINYPVRRLAWYLGAPDPAEAELMLLIHPYQDRPLNAAEWEAIAAHSGDMALTAWLAGLECGGGQAEAAGCPIPERRQPIRAIVDWRQASSYPALSVYPYPEDKRKPSRLFNVLPCGRLRVAWENIYRQTYSQ